MIPRDKYKSVHIDITTYNKNLNHSSSMNTQLHPKRFICDMCLNAKPQKEQRKRAQKICPICQRDICINKTTRDDTEITVLRVGDCNTKAVQTSESETNPNLDLLDEVLKVFKSKKEIGRKSKISKNVETSTEDLTGKTKLACSQVFLCCIDNYKNNDKMEYEVVNRYPSEGKKSMQLIKHKSSSIPQMKMDELKYALKEKTKSKDAIEEVNRMFATVRKYDLKNSNDSNRPMIRHGPRVLPVVKTKPIGECKYCQVNYMSSGDSAYECCHRKIDVKCDKCRYMLCCHYKNSMKQSQNDVVLYENCRENNCGKCWCENN